MPSQNLLILLLAHIACLRCSTLMHYVSSLCKFTVSLLLFGFCLTGMFSRITLRPARYTKANLWNFFQASRCPSCNPASGIRAWTVNRMTIKIMLKFLRVLGKMLVYYNENCAVCIYSNLHRGVSKLSCHLSCVTQVGDILFAAWFFTTKTSFGAVASCLNVS